MSQPAQTIEFERISLDVLLVEDNPGDARLVRELLSASTGLRFTTHHVNTLEDAIKRLQSGRFDAILLDLSLPDCTGYSTIRRMHAAAPNIPIVVLTGHADQQLELLAVREGVQDYLLKGEIQTESLIRSLNYSVERKRTEEALYEQKERVQVTLDSIGEGVITTDANGIVTYLNPVAESLTGWSNDLAVGKALHSVFNVVEETSRKPVPDLVSLCLAQGKAISMSIARVLVARNDQEYLIEDSASPMRDNNGDVLGVVLVFRDVTDSRRMAGEISYHASFDPLTGLVNRAEFERRLERTMTRTGEAASPGALCYLDLDQFKIVNDVAGHVAGDEMLKQVANVLLSRIRSGDTLARIGGDEFCVLLEQCDLSDAVDMAESLVDSLRDFRFEWMQRAFNIGVSIGLVPISSKSESAAQVLSQADVACYTAKDLGRNRIHIYEQKEPEVAQRHSDLHTAAELREALEHDRFRLLLQPIVPISARGGPDSRHEFLLRFINADGALVPPNAFIPAAERYGLMADIDRWVLVAALRAARAIMRQHPNARFAINLSGTSISDGLLLNAILQELRKSNVPSERVCFEITETAAIGNLGRAAALIRSLRGYGCQFALDDFGAGLSSFSYLRQLPVDYLKIDGSFIRNISVDKVNRALVAAINEVGHTMGIATVAEYVDSEAALAAVRELGVDFAQGFATGVPMTIEELQKS